VISFIDTSAAELTLLTIRLQICIEVGGILGPGLKRRP
jgi:hypothetical protein